MSNSVLRTKKLAFVCMMGALGNILGALSIFLANVGPIGLDLSHLATLIAAIYGGPVVGGITGVLVGIFPGTYFGFIGGNLGLLGLIGLPLGKALTGITMGLLSNYAKILRPSRSPFFTIPVVLLSYIPETIFTAAFFLVMVPLFFGWSSIAFLVSILIKGWGEFVILSIISYVLRRNKSFTGYVAGILQKPENRS